MADNAIFTIFLEVLRKAGANVSSVLSAGDATADAHLNDFSTQAESLINASTLFNWSDVYVSSLNVDVKGILKMASATWQAVECIRFDMSGYTSRQEALTMINSLLFQFKTCIIELKKVDVQDFMNGVT